MGLKSVIKLCTVTVGILGGGGYFVSICIELFWSKVLQIRGVSLIFGPKKRPQDFSWGGFWGGLMDFGEASGGLKGPGEACLPRGGHL